MNRWGLLVIALTLIALAGVTILITIPAPHPLPMAVAPASTTSSEGAASTPTATSTGITDLLAVSAPLPGAAVSSTSLTITGEARGQWYSEAVFPITVLDAQGHVIAQGQGHAQGEWMTTDFVPFTAALTYPAQPTGATGTVVLANDNPSGDPANAKSVAIPVVFR